MASPLKAATPQTIAKLIANYQPHHPLPPTATIPPNYTLLQHPTRPSLQRTFVFRDFKEAATHIVQISKLCASLNYFPEIFNVYNRVEVRLGSEGKVTEKDMYVACLLEESQSQTWEGAHEKALQRMK